jgi:ribosomal protein L11 methyltransferase
LNPGVETVEFRVADLVTGGLAAADIVTANLTGASLMRFAGLLLDLLQPGGTLIVSGLLETERDDVVRALAGPPISIVWEQREDGWVALAMKRS